MKTGRLNGLVILLVLTLLATLISGCVSQPVEAESYTAIAPQTLHPGEKETVSFTLLGAEGKPARGKVKVALLQNGEKVTTASGWIDGKGKLEFKVPSQLSKGEYELYVKGPSFEDKAEVNVEKDLLIFLQTDKPIYKPGQTIHIRALTLNSGLKPKSEKVQVEVLDAKGIKVFKKEVKTDEYGMASLDLPLSQEPNLGVWKIKASSGKSHVERDMRVKKYVLPKYEVDLELPRKWFLVNEPINGKVKAEYSFGKPVKGELEIKGLKYVGKWKEYAILSKKIDGETSFELPPVNWVAGVPAAKGMGNVKLEVTVKEKATGYKEKTTRLLTIAKKPLNIQIIPESPVFKPSLPFNFLIVTETPDNQPREVETNLRITYLDEDFEEISTEKKEVKTRKGKTILTITPPKESMALTIKASAEGAQASKTLKAGYSPSGNFIHVEQKSRGIPQVGEEISFKVHSTLEARNFYYEVISRDKMVFSGFTQEHEISFQTTPLMAPSSKLLVYQILPNSEIAADRLPFKVEGSYPQKVEAHFSREKARPGDKVTLKLKTEGKAKVGISAVDRSVFILAKNRLNLQQVFEKLEKLYMKPQAELHEVSIYSGIKSQGAKETFEDAGVVVLSSNKIPEGKTHRLKREQVPWLWRILGIRKGVMEERGLPRPKVPGSASKAELEEVERVRQYFPETWLWQNTFTDPSGKASLELKVPDTITTWMLRAVALSKEKGLGITKTQLKAFQPFFLKADLPYSAIRGEEFPVKVAVYNYLDRPQRVFVELEKAEWFNLMDEAGKWVNIPANDLGSAEFKIKPKLLGTNRLKITARSKEAADAVIKSLKVKPEGIPREVVKNFTLSGGDSKAVDTLIPEKAVEGSGRAYIGLTSNYLSQTIKGLEKLLKMPFGCGEQNMIVFAPDVYITKYLKESEQLKPEIMAKAEKLMITGYQRELTFCRNDGSFSAFGERDDKGSLFLTAFVLKCFSQAEDLIYIDRDVLKKAKEWILAHQNENGSFDSVGFVHHQELMGGVEGKDALTAYIAIALLEAGEKSSSAKAIEYLENRLSELNNPYTAAITAYALELAGSKAREEAHGKLLALAQEDENGLYWGGGEVKPLKENAKSIEIEATAYAALALLEHEDVLNASRAAKWLISQRNAHGGFDSTQDTVIALQALTEYCSKAQAKVDLKVKIDAGGEEKKLRITQANFDVLQLVKVPINKEVPITVEGEGEAVIQLVKRFNLPEVEEERQTLNLSVDYDATEVEVNDLVEVSVGVDFNPPIPMEAGMVVLDISVPTGFEPVTESLDEVINKEGKIKRYDVAGRKVIFYLKNLSPGEHISFNFQVKALYPVKAKGVVSKAHSYYKPEIKGETLSLALVVLKR